MQSEFVDRLLSCVDCHGQFVFTAGEQIFFLDKQFKNDPKRCKPCKSKRAALGSRTGSGPEGMPGRPGSARTETRTECSECHIETTVPFKPTQGRPVLCRQCFQGKRTPLAAVTPIAAASAVRMAGQRFDLAASAIPNAMPDAISTGRPEAIVDALTASPA